MPILIEVNSLSGTSQSKQRSSPNSLFNQAKSSVTQGIDSLNDRFFSGDNTRIILNGIIDVKENSSNYIAKYPVVKGTSRTDYVRPQPRIIESTIILSVNTTPHGVAGLVPPSLANITHLGHYIQDTKARLDNIKNLAQPVRIVWDYGVINYAAIKSLTYDYQQERINALMIKLLVDEIIVTGIVNSENGSQKFPNTQSVNNK